MPKSDRVYVATESFACQIEGKDYQITKGQTRVREGHPLLQTNPQYFRPMEENVHYDVEQATAAPGEKRGASA